MKRFAPRHAAVLMVLAGLLVAANFAIQPRRRAQQTRACQTNLKIIGLAMMQYTRDYDEHYPLATNWADALRVYSPLARTANTQSGDGKLFRCPTTGSFYAMNSFCAQLNVARIDDAATEPLFFDTMAGTRNLSDDGGLWPASPVHPWGERWGNNVGFADGHVQLRTDKPRFHSFN